MFNLIKHELKIRSKFLTVALGIYLLEHLYVAFKLSDNLKEEILMGLSANTVFTTLILTGIIFMHSIIDFNNHLRPKPGYMMFMANINRKSFIGTKFAVIFSEIFIVGIVACVSFFIQFFGFNLYGLVADHVQFDTYHNAMNLTDGILHILKVMLFFISHYLIAFSIFMFAITLKTLILKGRKFGGIITFAIAIGILFIRGIFIKLLGIGISQPIRRFGHNAGPRIGNHFGSISMINSDMIIFQILFTVLVIWGIIYMIEKKLDI